MDLGFAGKVAIVTGATANIGRAIALDFAAEGAAVIVAGRDADAGGSRFNRETGFFRTAFVGTAPADAAKRARSGPLDRQIARPEEVAAAVLYLASSRADFMTGQVLAVDGGTLL